MELQGRRAVVTGGGQGIGSAVAVTLAGAGASVVVAARSPDRIREVAEELRKHGGEAAGVMALARHRSRGRAGHSSIRPWPLGPNPSGSRSG